MNGNPTSGLARHLATVSSNVVPIFYLTSLRPHWEQTELKCQRMDITKLRSRNPSVTLFSAYDAP
jgi:hypothetical protein